MVQKHDLVRVLPHPQLQPMEVLDVQPAARIFPNPTRYPTFGNAVLIAGDFWIHEQAVEVVGLAVGEARVLQDRMRQVVDALRDYHLSLDNRTHGGIAAGHLVGRLEAILVMPWEQGKERLRKEKALSNEKQSGSVGTAETTGP